MDDLLKELAALEAATSFLTSTPSTSTAAFVPVSTTPSKGKSKSASASISVSSALDTLLSQLEHAKASLSAGENTEMVMKSVVGGVEEARRAVEERQKEGAKAYTEFGKAVDKTFNTGLPSMPQLFASPTARTALDRSIATHLIRTGTFPLADVLITESGLVLPPSTAAHFRELHTILTALKENNVHPALAWAKENADFLHSRSSQLPFKLHRHEYLRLLLSCSTPAEARIALDYARANLTPLYPAQQTDIQLLLNAVLYLPLERLQDSPYKDLARDAKEGAQELSPMFTHEWCARMGLPNEPPLEVIADIGGGPALSVLETNRRKMAKARNEWSSVNELPVRLLPCPHVELPVPVKHRYHTVVCCPVVREPTSEENPPMLLTCGHVISKEAITRLQKGSQRIKCPYCPVESNANQALRLYF
ncbi:hypothetical protein DACRYDRAFT_46914 [Dacryopinax primogenitus]|uniref:GID complex catalytic subunit 2 n=1 Tax=Dacryopinax primogenitus (strain DJM 731) TaxID=1858805 RepID=M5G661_DACPD|nr:uncharacterized protein DACRYDRAFT_46914 [Dacryopinax primogenitus]EJU05746.1 hypothetical protein DACRYDRAFT_46914 [Dacryopinax primogenitus]